MTENVTKVAVSEKPTPEVRQPPAGLTGTVENGGSHGPQQDRNRSVDLARVLLGTGTWIVLILVGLVIAFSIAAPEAFLSTQNFRSIAVNASILLVLAVGTTFVIITAGIDLSIGAVLVFSGVAAIKAMDAVGGAGWGTTLVGLGVALGCGAGWGLINGFLITKAKVPSLIATLGTLGIALGLSLVITEGVDLSGVPKPLSNIGIGNFPGGIPYVTAIAGVVAIVAGLCLSATRFGRYTYAVGSNPEAAARAGISVDRHLLKIYALMGLLSGFAGFLALARFSSTTVNGHNLENLKAVAAVVIGGTSLFGGVGTIFGTVIGVFIPSVLENGFVITGLQPFWQQVAVGVVLIVAVYLDQLRRARNRL
jgi:ribose transport system permease protein